jgi:hypothetical protein
MLVVIILLFVFIFQLWIQKTYAIMRTLGISVVKSFKQFLTVAVPVWLTATVGGVFLSKSFALTRAAETIQQFHMEALTIEDEYYPAVQVTIDAALPIMFAAGAAVLSVLIIICAFMRMSNKSVLEQLQKGR